MSKPLFYQKTTLKNGITVLSETMPNVRSVALGIWVGVGARDEPQEIAGMSHFLEHLLFKGTPSRTAKEISETFDSMGAELNAFTAKELTAFYARMLDEHLPLGIEVLADMLQNTTFMENDIAAEKQVVLEEINLHEDSPDELIHDIFSDSLYGKHPLGKRILGNQGTVKNFDRGKVRDFYRKTYSPSNTVVAAAGNFEHEKLVRLADRFFVNTYAAAFKKRKSKALSQSKLSVLNKTTEQAHICLGSLALSATDKDRFVLSVLDNILGGGMSSRLFQEIREKRGLAYSVYTYHSVHMETGSFCMYAGTSPKNVNEVIKIMQNEIQKIISEEVEENELNRAKQHITGQLVLGLENTSHRMMRLGKSELAQGKIYSVNELIDKVNKVSADDVKRVATRLLDNDVLNLSVIGPFTTDKFSYLDFKEQVQL